MKFNRVQVILASVAILAAAVLAQVLTPHELMARSSGTLNLQDVIPKKFGIWTLIPDISPVSPTDPDAYVELDKFAKVYSQEVGRGYSDGHGNIVMLMVAYGPVQNYRLKAHRPEICYTANGFRISNMFKSTLAYRDGGPAINVTRLTAQRESRVEPVTYWLRVGNDIATGPVESQMIRLKYGLQGLIPDGALIRFSTIGLAPEASFKLQDQFIRDLMAAIPPQDLKFFTGIS